MPTHPSNKELVIVMVELLFNPEPGESFGDYERRLVSVLERNDFEPVRVRCEEFESFRGSNRVASCPASGSGGQNEMLIPVKRNSYAGSSPASPANSSVKSETKESYELKETYVNENQSINNQSGRDYETLNESPKQVPPTYNNHRMGSEPLSACPVPLILEGVMA